MGGLQLQKTPRISHGHTPEGHKWTPGLTLQGKDSSCSPLFKNLQPEIHFLTRWCWTQPFLYPEATSAGWTLLLASSLFMQQTLQRTCCALQWAV